MVKKDNKLHPIRIARRAGVPLLAIQTNDCGATVATCITTIKGSAEDTVAFLQWDINRGLIGLNPKGKGSIGWYDPLTMQLPDIFKILADDKVNTVKGLVFFVLNPSRIMERDGVAQGLAILRDPFKAVGSICILVGNVVKLAPELACDVVVEDEPIPDRETITAIVNSIVADAKAAGAKITEEPDKVVSSLIGLGSAFDVEQTLSLETTKDGINVPGIWKRKIDRLRGQTGAEITIDNPDFTSVVGCNAAKNEVSMFIKGRKAPGVVFFADEIEKIFAGAGTDLSGVSTNLVGMFLTWCTERRVRGFLFCGIPGSGKTLLGTASAGEAGVPFVKCADLKASLVGESEQRLRAMLRTVDSLAGDGEVLMIGSCNWVEMLQPDILARFTMGQFFFDFASEAERLSLCKYYLKKYDLPDKPGDIVGLTQGWVGREFDSCAWRAWQYQKSFAEVASGICPSAVSQKAKLEKLRQQCSGRFLSANKPGLFNHSDEEESVQAAGRKFSMA